MRKQVMIVDDEPHIRLAVRKLLERKGIGVHSAEGGRECLEALGQGFRGVILMDVMMPEMNGWDTIREIVDHGYDDGTLIFMLTALDNPGEDICGLEEHVVDYITKPFDSKELVEVVERYLSYLDQSRD
jgi:DNA-binding response OmpR family regulator